MGRQIWCRRTLLVKQLGRAVHTFFEFPREIRRLIYTTNSVEGYHRQLRKVIKNKSSFPSPQATRKMC
ncbi:MAG: transposase [Chloroflexi bacterium]|nr:transposase [Chloroflexota bacterium]